jgi:hypothetical protein
MVWIVGGTVPENLVLGQVNPLLLLALALALWLLPQHPRAAAIAIGTAAALKVWPAALLLVFAWRRQWRPLLAGVALIAVLLATPAAITAVMVDPPEAPGFERPLRVGNAAPLNVSLPALALRFADPPRGGEMPASWTSGTSPAGFEPWARHGWIAATVAALVLIATALAIGVVPRAAGSRLSPPLADRDSAGAARSRTLELGAITAAAILAAPVGWYHYQLCQFPAFALMIERALAARRARAALLLLVLLALLTRAQSWGFGRYVERWGWTGEAPAALLIVTSVAPVLSAWWTAYLVREAKRARASSVGR